MQVSKKAWNHLGFFTRQEAVDLLTERLVSQKRRLPMKECVRIIYYCQVQRSSGCRYEMSVCIPNNPEEKLRIDDYNVHTCNPESARRKRRAIPRLEDFDKPIERREPPVIATGMKDDIAVQHSLNDSVTSSRLNDKFEADNDSKMVNQNGYECKTEIAMAPSENLAKFNSEFDGSARPFSTSESTFSKVWSTVDVEVVDFTKRPDSSFKYVFHAKDEASQYSYACPMINNQPDVIADALLNLFFQFGAPSSVKLDSSYRGSIIEEKLAEKFPSTDLVFYAENKNKQGVIAPRREESMIRERIIAWLMEHETFNWSKNLNEIKYMHNSEWIEELDGSRKRKADGTPRDVETSATATRITPMK
ncbi:hypothetical protein GCK32_003994 [Trichostrongylus colubriformis]|uniref:Uncharacterized protein n=1 Tax=Trichostrongylus colubriformis TaxID=6319 RepID=A0AAN8IL39_TRICO